MKIYTKVVFDWNPEIEQYEETYAETYDYDGEVDLCQTEIDTLLSKLPSLLLQMQALGIKEDEAEKTHTYRMEDLRIKEDWQKYTADAGAVDDLMLIKDPKARQIAFENILREGKEGVTHPRAQKEMRAQLAATRATNESIKSISETYLAPPMGVEPTYFPSGARDWMTDLDARMAHYTTGEGQARLAGHTGLAETIKLQKQEDITRMSRQMVSDSAIDMVTYFEEAGAIDEGQARFLGGQISAGATANVMPQLMELVSSDFLTKDEMVARLTTLSTSLGKTIETAEDMGAANLGQLLKAQELVTSKLFQATFPKPKEDDAPPAGGMTDEKLKKRYPSNVVDEAYSFLRSDDQLKEATSVAGRDITVADVTPQTIDTFLSKEVDYTTDAAGNVTFVNRLPAGQALTRGAQVNIANWQTGEEKRVAGPEAKRLMETGTWELSSDAAPYKEFPDKPLYKKKVMIGGEFKGTEVSKPPKEVEQGSMVIDKGTRKKYKVIRILKPSSMGRPYQIVVQDAITGKRLAPMTYDIFQETYAQPIQTR